MLAFQLALCRGRCRSGWGGGGGDGEGRMLQGSLLKRSNTDNEKAHLLYGYKSVALRLG